MNFKRWQELKQMLTEEENFGKIWEFYMDHFADHTKFLDLGKPVKNPYLSEVILKTSQELFGKNVKITDSLLIYIPRQQFFHGPFQAGGRIGGVIFFEDIKVGLLSVSAHNPPSDAVRYSRFTEVMQLSSPHDNN